MPHFSYRTAAIAKWKAYFLRRPLPSRLSLSKSSPIGAFQSALAACSSNTALTTSSASPAVRTSASLASAHAAAVEGPRAATERYSS